MNSRVTSFNSYVTVTVFIFKESSLEMETCRFSMSSWWKKSWLWIGTITGNDKSFVFPIIMLLNNIPAEIKQQEIHSSESICPRPPHSAVFSILARRSESLHAQMTNMKPDQTGEYFCVGKKIVFNHGIWMCHAWMEYGPKTAVNCLQVHTKLQSLFTDCVISRTIRNSPLKCFKQRRVCMNRFGYYMSCWKNLKHYTQVRVQLIPELNIVVEDKVKLYILA